MVKMNIEEINKEFFGNENTHRYLMDVYRECIEKLIVANTMVDVWARTKGTHTHLGKSNCVLCTVFFQIYFSCVDSLFLHLRLLFSRKELGLADSFLSKVKDLNESNFISYYTNTYSHSVTPDERELIKPLFKLADDNLTKVSELYIKRIEPYQLFVFHRPEDGKYYKVTTTRKSGEGLKRVSHIKKNKFKRDLVCAKEMLDLLGEVIHSYLKLTSKFYYTSKICPEDYVKEVIVVFGVEVEEKAKGEIIDSATKHTKSMVHVLECGSALNSHNQLMWAKLDRHNDSRS